MLLAKLLAAPTPAVSVSRGRRWWRARSVLRGRLCCCRRRLAVLRFLTSRGVEQPVSQKFRLCHPLSYASRFVASSHKSHRLLTSITPPLSPLRPPSMPSLQLHHRSAPVLPPPSYLCNPPPSQVAFGAHETPAVASSSDISPRPPLAAGNRFELPNQGVAAEGSHQSAGMSCILKSCRIWPDTAILTSRLPTQALQEQAPQLPRQPFFGFPSSTAVLKNIVLYRSLCAFFHTAAIPWETVVMMQPSSKFTC